MLANRQRNYAVLSAFLFAQAMAMSLLSIWLTRPLHLNGAQASTVFAVNSICALLAKPAYGFLSDRIGFRKVVLGSRPSSFTGLTTFPTQTQTQTDLSLSYDMTPDFRLGFDVNNVFNNIGIFSIQNTNLPVSGLSQAQIISMYPNATTCILTTQPRSFFLTGTANF